MSHREQMLVQEEPDQIPTAWELDIAQFVRDTKRRNRRDSIGAFLPMAIFGLVVAIVPYPLLAHWGFVALAVGHLVVLCVETFIARLCGDLVKHPACDVHHWREEMLRQARLRRHKPLWSLGPLIPGFSLLVWWASTCPGPDCIVAALLLTAVFGKRVWTSLREASRLERKADALGQEPDDRPRQAESQPAAGLPDTDDGSKGKTTPWAIGSVVLAAGSLVLGLWAGVPAIVCGHLARGRIRKGRGRPKGRLLTTCSLTAAYVVCAVEILGPAYSRLAPLVSATGGRDPMTKRTAERLIASGATEEKLGRRLFQPLIPNDGSIGIVVGTIRQGQQNVYRYGNPSFDGDTVFEIGSVTKVFTSLALACAAQAGELSLSDPIGKFLPGGVSPRSPGFSEIRLVHLATHSSGLPRLPPNLSLWAISRFKLFGLGSPYSGFDPHYLYLGLRTTRLNAAPGRRCEYSNFGMGLLGQLLANAARSDYESVIRQRICEPLNMTNTWVSLPPRLSTALASPQLRSGRPCSNWDIGALAGAGGLRSTVNDLLVFLSEHLAPSNVKLRDAIEMTLTERIRMSDSMSIGLGWHCRKHGDYQAWWHNGATGGYTSFIAMRRKEQVGVVVLGNADFWREITRTGSTFLAVVSMLAARDTEDEPGVPRVAAEG